MSDYFHSLKDCAVKTPVKGVKIRSVFLDKTMMTHMEFEPFSVLPEHKHDHEQITMILEGEMEMIVNGEKSLMKKGDVAAVPGSVLHSAKVTGQFTVAVDAWSPARDDYK